MINYTKETYFQFKCPDCHTVFSVDRGDLGKNVYCPVCGTIHSIKRTGEQNMKVDFPCWLDIYTCMECNPELVSPIERVWIETHEEWIEFICKNYCRGEQNGLGREVGI